jgi:hypothetical protein
LAAFPHFRFLLIIVLLSGSGFRQNLADQNNAKKGGPTIKKNIGQFWHGSVLSAILMCGDGVPVTVTKLVDFAVICHAHDGFCRLAGYRH